MGNYLDKPGLLSKFSGADLSGAKRRLNDNYITTIGDSVVTLLRHFARSVTTLLRHLTQNCIGSVSKFSCLLRGIVFTTDLFILYEVIDMAKHITVIPDCPNCGKELKGAYKNMPPFDDQHPWGIGIDGWWYCSCGYESEHIDHKPYDDIEEIVQ